MAAAFKTAAALALVAAFVVTMLYSRAVLTELNQQIAAQTNALADAQSENTRLSAQLDAKVSLRNVEEYATQALGMVSIDKSQITYVDLSEGDKIELTMDSPPVVADRPHPCCNQQRKKSGGLKQAPRQ